MNLEEIRQERLKWMTWKNILPLRQALDELDTFETECSFSDTVKVMSKVALSEEQKEKGKDFFANVILPTNDHKR